MKVGDFPDSLEGIALSREGCKPFRRLVRRKGRKGVLPLRTIRY
jgi:hypothetical protein